MRIRNTGPIAAVAVVLALVSQGSAKEPATLTTIAVKNMHCMSCARKMADKVYAVPGVERVSADVKTSQLFVTPKPSQSPSPRALWEAIEKAGFKPVRLQGPKGTFTAKPGA